MSDPRLDYKNEYPVELVAPDISCYKNTGSGVDYIVTIDSGFSEYATEAEEVSKTIRCIINFAEKEPDSITI